MVYRKGCRGNAVKKIQELLGIEVDGNFGPLTEKAVMDFQERYGLVVDGIVGEKTMSKLLEVFGCDDVSSSDIRRSKRVINEIIVHCTATKEGQDYTVSDITYWHKARGFNTIGYHYVIYRDGSLHLGRSVDLVGAHCTGHNQNSIGVVYIGGCALDGSPKDTRTNAQRAGLEILLRRLRTLYPKAKIYGHRDFAAKACPSFDATKEYRNI